MTIEATQLDLVHDLAAQAIPEVFKTMLSIDVALQPPAPLPADAEGEVVSSVAFIGEITGAVYLYATASFAKMLTARMLGLSEDEIEGGEMVNDALGELSNMTVGYIKSRLCDRGLSCTLTIPSIVRGQCLSVEKSSHVASHVIGFNYGAHHMLVEIFVKEL